MPKVSIVIPCYNHGLFLKESVDSVLAQTFQDFEIIIVNDGSTDPNTLEIIRNWSSPKTIVITTPNSGPAMARNKGINIARGDYIVALDADDVIEHTYIEKCVSVLEGDENIGIVYARARYFGAKKGKWNLPDFNPLFFLFENCIYCAAMFKRQDWDSVGGYNDNVDGLEDWDFWLSLITLGCSVHRIDEELFFYRKHRFEKAKKGNGIGGEKNLSQSVSNSIIQNKDRYSMVKQQIIKNHISLYEQNLDKLVLLLMENSILFTSDAKKLLSTKITPSKKIKVFIESA